MAARLNHTSIQVADYARQTHRIMPEPGTEIKDLLEPDYWSHVAAKLHVGDKVEAIAADGSWYVELLVQGCSRIHAKCAILNAKEFKNAEPVEDKEAPFYVAHRGPRKWSVLRRKDKAVVKEGFDLRDEASQWLVDNQADLLA